MAWGPAAAFEVVSVSANPSWELQPLPSRSHISKMTYTQVMTPYPSSIRPTSLPWVMESQK